ncbi:MAG: hypothetical protein Kow00108_17700 [Calditrichia bacterium]
MNEKTHIKLYSQRSIAIATYFGGPLAAGILIRQNALNLKREKQALNSLLIGIVSTFLIFFGIFQIPEEIIDKIPNAIIPLIYTGIIYLIVEKIQGNDLKIHKKNNGDFYSAWRAVGIGTISMIIITGFIFGSIFLEQTNWDQDKYDSGLTKFINNEEIAMQVFEMLDKYPKQEIVSFIETKGIPKWEENIKILDELKKIENLPVEYQEQINLLSEYCELRIQSFKLMSKAISEESSSYDSKIIRLHARINEIINKL